jgi:hypothetical protein
MLFSAPNDLTGSQVTSVQLPSTSVYSTSITIGLTSQEGNQTAFFISQHMGNVAAEVTFTVDIRTFLVSVTGSVPYTETRDIPLSFS